jgi:methionyl-tRNA formyltransferase
MKVIIFSTNTKHHTYFINKISEQFDICSIIYERRKIKKKYVTDPFFQEEEDEYEERFFEEVPKHIDNKKMIEVYSVNDKSLAEYVKHLKPDLGISFGTGIIKPYIFNIPKWGTINIHRGCIDKYRGLDSDLWALYNKDYNNIDVTLHYVDERLDTGNVISKKSINLDSIKDIYNIRYATTILATQMIIETLSEFKKQNTKISAQKQKQLGQYYSAMSLDDKFIALNNFLKYKTDTRQDSE